MFTVTSGHYEMLSCVSHSCANCQHYMIAICLPPQKKLKIALDSELQFSEKESKIELHLVLALYTYSFPRN